MTSLKFFISSFLLLSLPGGCGKHPIERPDGAEPPALSVQVAVVEPAEFAGREDAIGTVRPKLAAAISAKVSGTIVEAPIDPGAKVKAGDLLAKIDAREIQARADQASAAAVETRGEYERVKRLALTNAASQKELDAALARRDAAAGALNEAQTMLEYTVVRAPFDGVIARKLSEVGDLAQPGRVLFELEDPSKLRLEVEVPEQLGGMVRVGQALAVRIDAAPFEGEGIVDEIEPTIARASRTFPVKIALPDVRGLRSGQFGRATIPLPSGGGIYIPQTSIVSRGSLDLVHVVDREEGRARLRVIRAGRHEGDRVEVLSGLDAGELIVNEPPAALADGQKVNIAS